MKVKKQGGEFTPVMNSTERKALERAISILDDITGIRCQQQKGAEEAIVCIERILTPGKTFGPIDHDEE